MYDMTDNECRMYHEMLWQKIVEEIGKIADGDKRFTCITELKHRCIEEVTKDGSIPKPSADCDCYLCDHYSCMDCPLGSLTREGYCTAYYNFIHHMNDEEFEKAFEVAKQIRDVFKGGFAYDRY